MTISEMVITAMVASPTTVYLECEGKRYRDAVELANEHGNRLVESAEVLSGGGIRITLKPELDLSPLDFIDGGTIEAPGFPEDLGLPDYEGGDLADAEEVLGANE